MFATSILGYTLTTMWYIFILFISIIIAIWPALIAKGKGHSFFLYFLISIPFWWITFFVVLFLKDRNVKPTASTPPAAE